jgi:hypothetical protein
MINSASYAAHAESIDLRQINIENNPSPCRSRRVGQIKKQLLLVMKLTAVLVLVTCLQVSARGFGQGTVTISVKNVLVTEVFKEIEKQTSFRFLYRDEQGKPVEGVTVTIKGTDKSTSTNANGDFFLSSVEQDAVLVFTSVNLETSELKVSGKTELVVNGSQVDKLSDIMILIMR